MGIKNIKKNKCVLIILFCVLVFFVIIMNPFWFLNRKLTKELRIIQIPFTEHYYIANSYGKPLMYGIVEWAISDDYVYGYCTRKDEDYFIFSRKNHNAKFYTKKEESK